MKILYHITGAITFVNEIPWVVEPIYLAQVCHLYFFYWYVIYVFIMWLKLCENGRIWRCQHKFFEAI